MNETWPKVYDRGEKGEKTWSSESGKRKASDPVDQGQSETGVKGLHARTLKAEVDTRKRASRSD